MTEAFIRLKEMLPNPDKIQSKRQIVDQVRSLWIICHLTLGYYKFSYYWYVILWHILSSFIILCNLMSSEIKWCPIVASSYHLQQLIHPTVNKIGQMPQLWWKLYYTSTSMLGSEAYLLHAFMLYLTHIFG